MADNPLAFPVSWPAPNVPETGMTLRDYFAGQALAAMDLSSIGASPDGALTTAATKSAYAYADAMLRERGK